MLESKNNVYQKFIRPSKAVETRPPKQVMTQLQQRFQVRKLSALFFPSYRKQCILSIHSFLLEANCPSPHYVTINEYLIIFFMYFYKGRDKEYLVDTNNLSRHCKTLFWILHISFIKIMKRSLSYRLPCYLFEKYENELHILL